MTEPGRTPESLRALLSGIVDYAGLFPPAGLSMPDSMRNFAAYRTGAHEWMLGRFVLPVSRVDEFDSHAAGILDRGEGSRPWRVTALLGDDVRGDAERLLKFNCSHWHGSEIGHAVADVVELKTADADAIPAVLTDVPKFFRCYFEIPLGDDPSPYVKAAAAAGERAALKARTGGVTANAFPDAGAVVTFLEACVRARVPFKVTAGLHHAVRGEYALTYAPGSACGSMFGFLNVFMAAALLVAGGTRDDAVQLLEERSIDSYRFDDDGVRWRAHGVSTETLRDARWLAGAFGSCSFAEPVDELAAAGLLL